MRYYLTILCGLLINMVYSTELSTKPSESSIIKIESQSFNNYDGLVGNAPEKVTVSSTGAAFELMQNAAQYYVFFSQTLANGIYYEGRAYFRQNYLSQNPLVTVPISNISNPPGYGGAFKLGYNFHPSDDTELTPYFRFNAYNNMGPVYADQSGNYIHSQTYSYLLGSKLAFKVLPKFTPYIDIFAGYQDVPLQGYFPTGPIGSNQEITGYINQFQVTYEIGMGFKLAKYFSLIPYWQYITQTNSPSQTALDTINQGGFGISPFTGTQQVFAFKLNVSW